MVKRHIKRIAAQKTWNIMKKTSKFITRPNPGAHKFEDGISLSVIFKDVLSRANTTKEAKKILQNNEILVNQKKRKEPKFIIGLMDVLSIPKTNENFRLVIDTKGRLSLIKINEKEANITLGKIIKKTKIKDGRTQLNLSDSRNIIVDKDEYKIGDSLLIELPGQKIKEHLNFEKNSMVYLAKGGGVGHVGRLENIEGKSITLKLKSGKVVTTLKKYAFIIGKEKPVICVKEE